MEGKQAKIFSGREGGRVSRRTCLPDSPGGSPPPGSPRTRLMRSETAVAAAANAIAIQITAAGEKTALLRNIERYAARDLQGNDKTRMGFMPRIPETSNLYFERPGVR